MYEIFLQTPIHVCLHATPNVFYITALQFCDTFAWWQIRVEMLSELCCHTTYRTNKESKLKGKYSKGYMSEKKTIFFFVFFLCVFFTWIQLPPHCNEFAFNLILVFKQTTFDRLELAFTIYASRMHIVIYIARLL